MVRADPWYRRESFAKGLGACGYQVEGPPRGTPSPDDVLVIWNRYGHYHSLANQFEQAGARVIVAENGAMGRDWLGAYWYSLTLSAPGCAGAFAQGGPERWDSLGAELCEWRKIEGEVIILGQRGIGPPGIAMPAGWDRQQLEKFKRAGVPVRLREHPGEKRAVPLDRDLATASLVVTWSSGAALKALAWGIPVMYGLPQWIGAASAIQMPEQLRVPAQWPFKLDRLPMFRALGWTMWRTQEIETGEPFRRLIELPYSRSPAIHAAASFVGR